MVVAAVLVRQPDEARPAFCSDVLTITGRSLRCDVCKTRPATLEDPDRPACLCFRCAQRQC